MMKQTLKKTYDDFWPVPQPEDYFLPDRPETEMDYPDIGATVIGLGRHTHRKGKVIEVEERCEGIVVIIETKDPDGFRYVGAWPLDRVVVCND